MANKILLEIAVASLERALAAQRAGAHRLELCAALETGGLTPSLALVRQVRAAVTLPVHVLIRPRAGSFFYNDNEFVQMKSEVAAFRAEGIQGVVAGILSSDRTVDIARTRELASLASPLPVTFHRAFDETPDLKQALDDVIRAGAQRVLTSAGAPSAADAPEAIRQLIAQAGDRIILPGGGLHPGNISRVAQLPGVRELHTGLGTVLAYNDPGTARFESTIRACLAAL
jgi:copper homeostasis protein